ncbi:MAG: hypothetical protein K0R54_2033 [Clostridiaceae bacterium]|jgi:predicted thioesterase|nr:hypothetical protein [Clostridiaceae bacterium]
MDLNSILEVGKTHTDEYTVKQEDTAAFIGNKDVNMLSTPSMIKFMELTAAHMVFGNLPENYRPVGTKVDIVHMNPTPVDMKVTVRATLTEIEGEKLCFSVEAFNKNGRVGCGLYEQRVIDLDDFLYKY